MSERAKFINLCGMAAVGARWRKDPASIQRLFFDYDTGRKIGAMTKALAKARKIYRCVEAEELEKVVGSVHHGGIVAVVETRELESPRLGDLERWAEARESVLVLDRIGNAHNLGAIVRTAAFYGVKHIIIPDTAMSAWPNDAAFRVAEGGFEHVTVWLPRNLVTLVADMAATGFAVVGAVTRGGNDQVENLKATRAVALVLGNEEHGLSPALAAACTHRVTLPGTGAVESLNVSVAGAVLLDRLLGR